MANDGFNGSTLTIAGHTLGPLRSITCNQSCAKADTTGSAMSAKVYEPGIPDIEVTFEIVGGADIDPAHRCGTAVTWSDAGTDGTITLATVTAVNTTGSMDGEITTTITCVPSTAG